MTLRDSREYDREAPPRADADAPGGDDIAAARDEGQALLAAADAAIARALSRDSNEFLAQNRQLGGQ